MLGKLTKNSFKANMSSVSGVYLAMIILGAVMGILLLIDWSKWGDLGFGLGTLIKCLAAGALCLTAFIGVIMTLVGVISEYSRNMFGAEGHLTMTLPVKSSTLLLSKWISGSFWVLVSYGVLCLCAFGSFIYIINHTLSAIENNAMYYSVYEVVVQMIEELCKAFDVVMPRMDLLVNLASMYAFEFAIRLCGFVILIYFSITLSHCKPFHKAGKFGGIIYFFLSIFGVFTFESMIAKFVKVYIIFNEEFYTLTLSQSEVAAGWEFGFPAYCVTKVYCAALASIFIFVLTSILIERKVNVS